MAILNASKTEHMKSIYQKSKVAASLHTGVSFLVLFYMALAFSCRADETAISGEKAVELSSKEVAACRSAAVDKHDMKAAYRLFLFYELAKLDHAESRKWLILAANGGNVTAQLSLGVHLVENPTTRSEGVQWLRKAAAQGSVDAKRELAHIEKQ